MYKLHVFFLHDDIHWVDGESFPQLVDRVANLVVGIFADCMLLQVGRNVNFWTGQGRLLAKVEQRTKEVSLLTLTDPF